jgi:hypothetical protein
MPLKLSPTQVAFNARGDGTFNKPFSEQVDFFRQKLNLPTERYDDILKAAHDRAFVVAGAMKADLLDDLRQAVDSAIADGKSIQWFRKEFAGIVQKHGWEGWTGSDTKAGRDWRTRVIYRTNLSTSYAAGRWQQLNDPDLLKRRPYWKYIHNDTVRHPRPLHQSWSGLVLRYDDPFWQTHFPPNGWGCQCRITAVRPSEYKGNPAPDDGTYIYKSKNGDEHVLPKGLDYGWNYAPGASVGQSMQPFIDTKAAALPKPIAEAFKQEVTQVVNALSVSQALKLPTHGVAKKAGINALSYIDALHSIDNLPVIPVKNSSSKKFQGQYSYYAAGKADSISISTASVNPELTLAHEVGHFIDHQAIGIAGTYSSSNDALFEAWRVAVDASQATQDLRDLAAAARDSSMRKNTKYYLSRWEQWARSYAQWVATKSGDKTMIEQVSKIVSSSRNLAYKASQWTDKDFDPIAKAIDEIFVQQGWLK